MPSIHFSRELNEKYQNLIDFISELISENTVYIVDKHHGRRFPSDIIIDQENEYYEKDLHTFPLEFHGAETQIELSIWFIERILWGPVFNWRDGESFTDSLKKVNSALETNQGGKILLNAIIRKIQNIANNHESATINAKEYFHLPKDTPEETVLRAVIKHLDLIKQDPNRQIQIFRNVLLPKSFSDSIAQFFIQFCFERLKLLNPELNELLETYKSNEINSVHKLPHDFNPSYLKNKTSPLSVKGVFILFSYLQEAKILINYDQNSLSLLANLLTGSSAEKLKRDKGFGKRALILKEEVNGIKCFYPKHVIELLSETINKIEEDISTY